MTAHSKQQAGQRLKIGFVLSRSFTLSAFALFVDAIRLASDQLDRSGRVAADWQVLGNTRHMITSSCGVQVSPTSSLTEAASYDYIVVVGGLLKHENPLDDETVSFLKNAAQKRVNLIGLCTGSFILAEAGLLNRHETCVSWLHYNEFRERFPELKVRSDRLYSLDHERGSCAGGSSAVDLAADIVRRHLGPEAERNALEVLQVERARSNRDIQPRRPLSVEVEDGRIKAALIIMEGNVGNRLPVHRLASSVGLSRRQLERLFATKANMTLGEAYKKIMLDKALIRVGGTTIPFVDVAHEFGFQSAATFSRNFKRNFGETPTSYRLRKAGAGKASSSHPLRSGTSV